MPKNLDTIELYSIPPVFGGMVYKILILSLTLIATDSIAQDTIPISDTINREAYIWGIVPKLNSTGSDFEYKTEYLDFPETKSRFIQIIKEISLMERDTIIDTLAIYQCKYKMSISGSHSYSKDLNGKPLESRSALSFKRDSSRVNYINNLYSITTLDGKIENFKFQDHYFVNSSFGGRYLILTSSSFQPGGATFWTENGYCLCEKVE